MQNKGATEVRGEMDVARAKPKPWASAKNSWDASLQPVAAANLRGRLKVAFFLVDGVHLARITQGIGGCG